MKSKFFLLVKHFLKLVIQHQHQGAANTSPEVTQVSLEETGESFSLHDLRPAVNSSTVLSFSYRLATLHHQSSSNCVQGVGKGF